MIGPKILQPNRANSTQVRTELNPIRNGLSFQAVYPPIIDNPHRIIKNQNSKPTSIVYLPLLALRGIFLPLEALFHSSTLTPCFSRDFLWMLK